MVYFRELAPADINEMKLQHSEWFPAVYLASVYNNHQDFIKIGCFVQMPESVCLPDGAARRKGDGSELPFGPGGGGNGRPKVDPGLLDAFREVMLGSILARVST